MSEKAEAESLVADNIDSVIRLESAALSSRTRADRASDGIAAFVGSIPFVLTQLALAVLWVVVNTDLVPQVRAFDPYPFSLLSMIVSTEGVLLSAFVLIKQNRMGTIADRRAHLDLQVNLLTEREVTRLLQVSEEVAERLGLEKARKTPTALAQETEVEHLAGALDRKLAEDD